MATILAHITARPGSAARFESIARDLYERTHREEPDVRRYEYWRGSAPDSYYSLLSFDTVQDFLTHQTSDHHEAASPMLGETIASPRLEWVDPLAGTSPLSPTVADELPDDASDLRRRYAVRFAPDVAAWWSTLRAAPGD